MNWSQLQERSRPKDPLPLHLSVVCSEAICRIHFTSVKQYNVQLQSMLISIFFCVVFVIFYIGEMKNIKMLAEEYTHTSWAGLRDGKYWILITATFAHASTSHLVNNAAMLIGASRPIESCLGPVWFVAFFLLTGAVGWGVSMFNNFVRYRESMIWEWVSSCGSSPATYAMLLFLVAVDSNMLLAPKLTWVCVGVFVAAELWSMVIRAAEQIKIDVNKSMFVGLLVVMVSLCLTIERPITTGDLMYAYFIKSGVFRLLNVCVFDRGSLSYPGSDHAAHFGGSLCGAIVGILFSINEGDAGTKLVTVTPPLIFLLLRLVTNF